MTLEKSHITDEPVEFMKLPVQVKKPAEFEKQPIDA